MRWYYRLCRPLVSTGFRLLSDWQIKGRENVPLSGPVLVVANHMTNLDPPLLSISLGRYVVFMAKEELFRLPPLGRLLAGLGAFPVERGRVRRRALRLAEKVLADGQALAVFPEGTRSRSHRLQRASAGAAAIALRCGVPVLPAGITGTERVSGVGSLLRRPKVTVTFGPPFHLPPPGGSADRRMCTDYIMERIAELLPPEYRGVYAGERAR